jgi:hypothetical protein
MKQLAQDLCSELLAGELTVFEPEVEGRLACWLDPQVVEQFEVGRIQSLLQTYEFRYELMLATRRATRSLRDWNLNQESNWSRERDRTDLSRQALGRVEGEQTVDHIERQGIGFRIEAEKGHAPLER